MNESHDGEDRVWRALAHSTRRQILDLLVQSPSTTGELVEALGLDRFVVMSHLAVLREAALVTSERRGRQRINHLNPVPIQQIHHRWITPVSGPWAAAVIAVRDAVENASPRNDGTPEEAESRRRSG